MLKLDKIPLVVIVGPTASGKTDLAIEIAEKFNGEIICADSRTVYKGMDIATAKPSLEQQQAIKHWGLDLVLPDQKFTVSDFKNYAELKIEEIKHRGKVPFLVGGSGLYIDSVLYDYKFGAAVDENLRLTLNQKSLEELYEYCSKNNITLPENFKNKRYVIRAIEIGSPNNSQPKVPRSDSIIVGITTDKSILKSRISRRIDNMLSSDVVNEAVNLNRIYGWNIEPMKSNIYQIIRKHLSGDIDYDHIKEFAVLSDMRLVKKQLTWFKRNKHITWLGIDEAKDYLDKKLSAVISA